MGERDRVLVNSASDWVDGQEGTWAKFTLHHPRLTKEEYWNEPLKVMFRVLSKTYPKISVKNRRKRLPIPILNLRYITCLGGDRTSGVLLHAQGLVEVFDDDNDHTRLKHYMGRAWKSASKKQMKHQYQPVGAVLDGDKIWVDTDNYVGTSSDYLEYLTRSEGPDLGKGIMKVIWDATSLR